MEFIDTEEDSNVSDIVWIALTFGLRRSEILGLRENSVDFKKKYLKINGKVKKLLIAFGEPDMSLHKLRYSAASILCEQGCSVKEIQYYLGHGDASTTLNIYTHIERQNLKAGLIEL